LEIPDASSRVPVPCATGVLEKPDGTLVVLRRRRGAFRRVVLRLFGVKGEVEVRLDRLGSAAWRLMDGRRTLAQIRAQLETLFPGEDNVALRLGRFVGMLASRRMLELE
jgi:hypothetical protein